MLGIPDEPLPLRIDQPIHQFQGDLTDHQGKFVWNLSHIADAITPLDGQPDGAVICSGT